MGGEEWKEIGWLKGLYSVSTEGRVVSLSRKIFNRKDGFYWSRPRLMRQSIQFSNGVPYYNVILTDENGKQHRKTVHRLAMMEFVPNPNNYSDVDHINRNSLDNRIANLRWCSRKMNMANDNTKKILATCHKGADHSYRWRPVVRLKDGIEVKRYKSITEAIKDGYNGHNITQVCRRKKKSHRGYQWIYLDEYKKRCD